MPGKPGDQAVAADEQRDHHLFDHFFLAHDHPVNLGDDLVRGPSGIARRGPADRRSLGFVWGEWTFRMLAYSFTFVFSCVQFQQ